MRPLVIATIAAAVVKKLRMVRTSRRRAFGCGWFVRRRRFRGNDDGRLRTRYGCGRAWFASYEPHDRPEHDDDQDRPEEDAVHQFMNQDRLKDAEQHHRHDGRTDDARRHFREAARLVPADKEIAAALRRAEAAG